MPAFADRKFKIKARAGPGRQPVEIDSYFAEIQPYLRLGMSLSKSSLCAGIPKRTVYDYYNADSVFRTKCDAAMMAAGALARSIVLKAIKDGDASLALEYLRNTEPEEFATRAQVQQETRHVIDFDAEFDQRVKKYHDADIVTVPTLGERTEKPADVGSQAGIHPENAPKETHAADVR